MYFQHTEDGVILQQKIKNQEKEWGEETKQKDTTWREKIRTGKKHNVLMLAKGAKGNEKSFWNISREKKY